MLQYALKCKKMAVDRMKGTIASPADLMAFVSTSHYCPRLWIEVTLFPLFEQLDRIVGLAL